ncbi:MAG: hypothetical protein HPY71_12950 [Firmicutes bacterium]|nr:hypothetical protein [Bacillota bacterium]
MKIAKPVLVLVKELKRKSIIAEIAGIAGIGLAVLCLSGFAGVWGRESRPPAFVDMKRALEEHPGWERVLAIEREMEESKAKWQDYVDNSLLTEQDINAYYARVKARLEEDARTIEERRSASIQSEAAAMTRRIGRYEDDVRAEVDQKVKAQAEILRQQVEDDLYAEQGRLNNEFDDFKKETVRGYYMPMLNIQFKLKLAQLKEGERKDLEAELERLQSEMEGLIKAKDEELKGRYEQYASERRRQAEEQLTTFEAGEIKAAAERVARYRAELEQESESRLKRMDEEMARDAKSHREEIIREANAELQARQAELGSRLAAEEEHFRRRYDALREERAALEAEIRREIEAAARAIADARGLEVRFLEAGGRPEGRLEGQPGAQPGGQQTDVTAAGALDITDEVIRYFH